MLYVHILTADSNASAKCKEQLYKHLNEYTNYKYESTDTMLGFRLKLENVLSWKDAKQLISTFETIITNCNLRSEIWEVHFS